MKKPLDSTPNLRFRKSAAKAAVDIVKVVCETLHPKGSKQEIKDLAEESLQTLKSVMDDSSNHMSETLKSIIEQYKNCVTNVIRRALLSEIVKQLKLKEIRKQVDVSVTLYE